MALSAAFPIMFDSSTGLAITVFERHDNKGLASEYQPNKGVN